MLILDEVRLQLGDFALQADITVPAGAVMALMGPSGAGKSTLLAAIAGFVTAASGRVLWNGADLTPLAPGLRPVSILFQDNNLFPHLTILQNLALGFRPSGRMTGEESVQTTQMLARVGLEGLDGRSPAALSGGQQSRAALARVLLSPRPLVLLDEPFAALGPALKDDMLDLAADLLTRAGRTVLLVTHDPADAQRIASHVIGVEWGVEGGVVAGPVPTADFLADPPSGLRFYLGDRPR